MDKRTQRILEQDHFPICVTAPFARKDDPILQKWGKSFASKGILWTLKRGAKGGWVLWRAITAQELAEIKRGKWIIRGGGFKRPNKE